MKQIFHRCLDLLYPPKCVFCDALLGEGEEYFCRSCGEKVPLAEGDKLCRTGTYFDRCVAPLYYTDMVRDSFLDYKFHEKTWHGAVYAAFLEPYVRRAFPALDVITWVPLGRRSQRDRGYDQSELLAKELARRMDLPCEKLLEKVRDTQQQSRLQQPEARRANVLGAYGVKANAAVQGEKNSGGGRCDHHREHHRRVLPRAGAGRCVGDSLRRAGPGGGQGGRCGAQRGKLRNEGLAKAEQSRYNSKLE